MTFRRIAHWVGGILLAAGLAASGSGSAIAQTTPLPRAEPTVNLYSQLDHVGNYVDSSDWGSHFSNLASQAADDFVVPKNAFWKIATVTASGQYVGAAGSGVLSLLIQIYADSGLNKPVSTPLMSQTFASGSIGGLATGVYVVTLASPPTLGPGHYWLSAQARENCTVADGTNCKHWAWTERTVKVNSESVWRSPPGSYGPSCLNWGPRITLCHQPTGSTFPDLLFSLDGTSVPVNALILLPLIHR